MRPAHSSPAGLASPSRSLSPVAAAPACSSADQANSLNSQLDQVSTAVVSGQCGAAANAASGLTNAVENLSGSVNATLVSNLRQGVSTVSELAARNCHPLDHHPDHSDHSDDNDEHHHHAHRHDPEHSEHNDVRTPNHEHCNHHHPGGYYFHGWRHRRRRHRRRGWKRWRQRGRWNRQRQRKRQRTMTGTTTIAGRYRIEGRLGVGGMSTVHLAFDQRLERYVALKLLAEHLADDPTFVSRFRREALSAARLVASQHRPGFRFRVRHVITSTSS